MAKCSKCGKPATFTDSVPDHNASTRHGEFAYQVIALCDYHAAERRMYVGNTTRLEPIQAAADVLAEKDGG